MLALCGAVHACGTAPVEPTTFDCNPAACSCKISDPIEHCVRLDECRSDGDCPAGTICLDAPGGESTLGPGLDACVPSTSTRMRCRISKERFDRALIDGFGVNEFLIEPVADTSSFAFSPTIEVKRVACALFGCRPDVKSVERTDVEGTTSKEIVNYEQCSVSGPPTPFTTLGESTTQSGYRAFTPSVLATAFVTTGKDAPTPCDDVPGALPARERQLTELGVGCWAYDETRLIAATRITPVPADQIARLTNIETILSASCARPASERMGKSCLLDGAAPMLDGTTLSLIDAPQFGACFEGLCNPRCVTASDCPAAVATKGCPHPTATCTRDGPDGIDGPGGMGGMSGQGRMPSFVGVCRYTLCDRPAAASAGDAGP